MIKAVFLTCILSIVFTKKWNYPYVFIGWSYKSAIWKYEFLEETHILSMYTSHSISRHKPVTDKMGF